MTKDQRLVESLHALLKEKAEIEETIATLPRGYISVKTISGHVYNYRQWREGNKIVSSYVPETLLSSTKRKIALRKEQEALLKDVKKEIRSVSRKAIRAGLITEDEISNL